MTNVCVRLSGGVDVDDREREYQRLIASRYHAAAASEHSPNRAVDSRREAAAAAPESHDMAQRDLAEYRSIPPTDMQRDMLESRGVDPRDLPRKEYDIKSPPALQLPSTSPHLRQVCIVLETVST